MQQPDFSDPLAVQQAQAYQALQQSQQNKQYRSPQAQGMVGRVYVGTNPLQHVAELLRANQAQGQEQEAMKQLQGIGQQRQEAQGRDMSAFVQALRGTPAQPEFQAAGPAPQGMPQEGGYTVPAQAAKPGDAYGAYAQAAASQSPMVRQMGMQGMAQLPQMEQEAALKREKMAQDAQTEKNRLADKQEARQFALSNRPEKMVTVLGPNGEAISMPQSQAGGMQMYNPMAAKEMQKQRTQGKAREDLSGVVQQLNNAYDSLNEGGGIVSTEKGGLSNILSRVGSTGVGQAVGGALGTENQKQRQFIEQTRPLLLNFIKEATGMSAQQMNSNAEMQLYLKAATDPTLSVEANRDALANLDKMFGLGLAKPSGAAKPAAPAANPQDAAAMQWAKQNPNDPRSAQILQRLGGQ